MCDPVEVGAARAGAAGSRFKAITRAVSRAIRQAFMGILLGPSSRLLEVHRGDGIPAAFAAAHA